jgi:hypothetical protein
MLVALRKVLFICFAPNPATAALGAAYQDGIVVKAKGSGSKIV